MYLVDFEGARARGGVRWPDFVCVGAQKSATTWLDTVMRDQSDLYLPPIKEVHYFSQLYNRDVRGYGPQFRAQQIADRRSAMAAKHELPENSRAIEEVLAHLEQPEIDDHWYGGIFARAPTNSVCGEICPSYMNLPVAGVRHLLDSCANVKILVLVRDPVQRCWSHIRMHVMQGYLDRNFDRLVSGEVSLLPYLFYTDYASSLRMWRAYTQPGRLKILLHDDILADGAAALKEIRQFVGLEHRPAPASVSKQVLKGHQIEMPRNLHAKLFEKLAPQYEYLHDEFPERVGQWLENHRAALA